MSTAEKDGYHYLMVMMGAPQYDSNGEKLEENMVFKQTIELYDWAFSSFSNKTLIEKDVGVGEVPLKLARGGKDYLLIKSGEVFTDLLPNEIEASSITMELDLPAVVNAPIKEGDQVGTIRLMLAGEEIGSVPAVAAEDVDASLIATLIDQFKRLFRSFLAKFIVVFVTEHHCLYHHYRPEGPQQEPLLPPPGLISQYNIIVINNAYKKHRAFRRENPVFSSIVRRHAAQSARNRSATRTVMSSSRPGC